MSLKNDRLVEKIKVWAVELGFADAAISGIDLSDDEVKLVQWLEKGFHGDMDYMARHGVKRSRPELLVPGTISVVSVRMDYLPETMDHSIDILDTDDTAYISRYALGRDYHKVIRNKLQKLAAKINCEISPLGYRAFCDSAPVLEKALAVNAGIGWLGKHSNVLCRSGGSWFFLGELYIDVALEPDPPVTSHCGSCTVCIDVCPTGAIVAPYLVDARRCISYLTIELKSAIPEEFRKQIGNRIYGCDDCQLFCPWNRYAKISCEKDFAIRDQLFNRKLTELFTWNEPRFLEMTAGTAIRRIGHDCWLRNIAVALGNTATSAEVIEALQNRLDHPSEMVREHVHWALDQHQTT